MDFLAVLRGARSGKSSNGVNATAANFSTGYLQSPSFSVPPNFGGSGRYFGNFPYEGIM
jgi:hypothetical protein